MWVFAAIRRIVSGGGGEGRGGAIGRPSVIRSQTCDKLDPSGFFVDYAQFSGGIFVDCNVHDIDLTLWYFGQDSVVKSVTAVGITAVQPGLKKWAMSTTVLASSSSMAAESHTSTGAE